MIEFGKNERDDKFLQDSQNPLYTGVNAESLNSGSNWGVFGASAEYAFEYETPGALQSQYASYGFDDKTIDNTLSFFRDSEHTFEAGNNTGLGQLFGSNTLGPNRRRDLFEELINDDEKIQWYEDYRKEHPDANLPSIADAKAGVLADYEASVKKLQDAKNRTEDDWAQWTAETVGGFSAMLNPITLATLPVGGGLFQGGLKGAAIATSKIGTATFAEQLIVQSNVGDFKKHVGAEHDYWNSVITNTAFGFLFPAGMKGIQATYKGVSGRFGGKAGQTIADDVSFREENTKPIDVYELNRADRLFDDGLVEGAQFPIHKLDDVNLKGINSLHKSQMESEANAMMASTIRANFGVESANDLLSQLTKAGRDISSLTQNELIQFRGQAKVNGKLDLAKAGKAIADIKAIKEEPVKTPDIIKTSDESGNKLPRNLDDELVDPVYDTVIGKLDDGTPITYRDKIKSLEQDMKLLDDAFDCY